MGEAAGLGLGLSVMRSIQGGLAPQATPHMPESNAAAQFIACIGCSHPIQASSKFCPECGTRQVKQICLTCKQPLQPNSKFCVNCGTAVEN